MSDSLDRWNTIFPTQKPVLAMLHLGGDTREEKLTRAVKETQILSDCGVDAVIVENYFGDDIDVERALAAISSERPRVKVGLNVLRKTERAFALAQNYPVDFIQIDSVAGHLPPEEDADYAKQLAQWRAEFPGLILGGVRFKYQEVRSGRSEQEDLRLGAERCDAIVVTGAGTGQETEIDKTERFRQVLGHRFPLIIGAGLTAKNAREQLAHAEGAIVGSYLKDTYHDTGLVEPEHVRAFMAQVRLARNTAEEQV
ncbi:MAG: BtpA/SgcQ family protein [Canibacter sp.]